MVRWLFPLGLILILFGVALAQWEASAPETGTAPDSTRTPAREASLNPGGVAAASTAPDAQTSGGTGQLVQQHQALVQHRRYRRLLLIQQLPQGIHSA